MADILQEITSNKNEILIARSCNSEDAEALQKFFQQGAGESTHTLICKDREPSLLILKERAESALKSSSEIYLGAFEESKIIGQLYFRAISPEHPWIKHIGEFGMMISANFWGKGLGYELLNIMENFAKKIGVSKIEAKVRTTNERGLIFYKRNGYEIEGTRKKQFL